MAAGRKMAPMRRAAPPIRGFLSPESHDPAYAQDQAHHCKLMRMDEDQQRARQRRLDASAPGCAKHKLHPPPQHPDQQRHR